MLPSLFKDAQYDFLCLFPSQWWTKGWKGRLPPTMFGLTGFIQALKVLENSWIKKWDLWPCNCLNLRINAWKCLFFFSSAFLILWSWELLLWKSHNDGTGGGGQTKGIILLQECLWHIALEKSLNFNFCLHTNSWLMYLYMGRQCHLCLPQPQFPGSWTLTTAPPLLIPSLPRPSSLLPSLPIPLLITHIYLCSTKNKFCVCQWREWSRCIQWKTITRRNYGLDSGIMMMSLSTVLHVSIFSLYLGLHNIVFMLS